MTGETLDLFGARDRRDTGIARAGDHADRVEESWTQRAATLIGEYGLRCGRPFLIEEVIPFAAERGLPDPPDGRAWGAAAQLARRRRLIVSCGYRKAKTSNLSPKVLWKSA